MISVTQTSAAEGANIGRDALGILPAPDGESGDGRRELDLGGPSGKRSREGQDEVSVGTARPLVGEDIVGRPARVCENKLIFR